MDAKIYTIPYSKDTSAYSLEPKDDYLVVANSGDYIILETMNAFSQETNTEEELNNIISMGHHHPFTGPVFINQAYPGDTVAVKIEKIKLSEYAYTCISRSSGILDCFKTRNYRKIKINNNGMVFNGIRLDAKASLGGIGLADPSNTRNGATCKYGGNLDFKFLVPGATIYLPVAIRGGLLYIGDVHALQGNGEISGISLEASSEVHISTCVHKCSIPGPILDIEEGTMIVGYGETFDKAVKMAVDISVDLLNENLKIDKEDAYMLLGCSSDIVIGHLTGRIKSVAVLIPREILSTKQIINKLA